MKCQWPDGKVVAVTLDGQIVGNPRVVVTANEWLFRQSVRGGGLIAVTPTGPFVPESDPLAKFTAINATFPSGTWTDAPDLTYGLPADTVF